VSVPESGAVWQLWCDGTAAPNPGRIGLGVLLVGPDGAHSHHSLAPGGGGCNNVAELSALRHGLQLASAAGATRLAVYSDSDFLVRHVGGECATGVAPLAALVTDIRTRIEAFEQVSLHWIPRHRNGEADRLARAALGLKEKPALRPISRKRRR